MIAIEGLRFGYSDGAFAMEIPSLHVARGEKVAFIGPSGSGKTTLAYLIAGILTPRAGSIAVGGAELARRGDAWRRDFRISKIGFVFQEFELLEYLSVRDNMLLPYYVNATLGLTPQVHRAIEGLAASMDLGDKLRRYPKALSHGERQRVAICRALATSPDMLIADEPTGNLDPKTAETTLALLLGEVERRQMTLLVVTHNYALLDAFDRVVNVQDFTRGNTP
jgi:putative ABC transport system ATP-binding protein